MNYNVDTINDYLEVIPVGRKEILLKLISIVKEYFPEIDGTMEYKMPSFNPVCAMASQKHYISLYIHHTDLVEKHREELGNLKVGKSCIRFKTMAQMPEKSIRSILYEIKNKK